MNARRRNPFVLILVAIVLLIVTMLVSRFFPLDQPALRVRITDGGADVDSPMIEGDAIADAAKASGPAPARKTSGPTLTLVAAKSTADQNAAQGAFEGKVVSFSTGEGVGGAELSFARGGVMSSTRSDADGRFRFEPSEQGSHELAVVTAEGFLPFAPEWGHSPIRLLARPGIKVQDIVITLRPAVDYQGLVVDPDDRPVAKALVQVLSTPGGQTDLIPLVERFETDEQGAFTFHAPDNALLEAAHPDYSPGRARLDFTAQVSHRLKIRLAPHGESRGELIISGQVFDDDGEPLLGALVVANSLAENPAAEDASQLNTAQTLSDEGGGFVLEGLDEGEYLVIASSEDLAPARLEGVVAGAQGLRLELTAGAILRGEVTDVETSEPLAGFSVLVMLEVSELQRWPYRTATVFDSEGRYEIPGLAPGDYEILATAQGYAPGKAQSLEVPDPTPEEPLEASFELDRGGKLAGQVVDSVSKVGLPNARVSVEGLYGSSASAVPLLTSTTTDFSGSFELGGITDGLRSLRVAAHNHHSRIISGLSMTPGGNIGPLTIDLRPVAEGEEPSLELTGIGVVLAARDDVLVVGEIIADGGAAEAGLAQGDEILTVDGASVALLGFQGSIERIRGPEGSVVILSVRRAATGQVEVLVVHRRRITA